MHKRVSRLLAAVGASKPSTMLRIGRGDEALRRRRYSVRGASYFLTLCTADRAVELTESPTARAIQTEIAESERAGHWRIQAAVIMPDHLHLLAELTGDLPISRCIARLKTKTRPNLLNQGISWQGNFYEHRLRPEEPSRLVIRYLFLNPARAELVHASESYPWFWLGAEENAWFRPTTDAGMPFPEWLD